MMILLIRALRKLPHSWRFDDHLTRCVAAHLFYDEHLSVGKVFGWRALESEVDVSKSLDDRIAEAQEMADAMNERDSGTAIN